MHAILFPCISTDVTFLVIIVLIWTAGMHALYKHTSVIMQKYNYCKQTLLSLQTSIHLV